MARVYLIVGQDGWPLVWRLHNVLESIRVFEDGHVADAHRLKAIDMGYSADLKLLRQSSFAAAQQYVLERIKEHVWFQLFSLSYGYDDKYAYNPQ